MSNPIRHYPTPTTTTYYVDEYLIDDIYRVDFHRKVTEQPVWGYASRRFDFVARGREIVTGNIIINFRYPGYLRNIIKLKESRTDRLTADMVKHKLVDASRDKLHKDLASSLLSDFDITTSPAQRLQMISDIIAGKNLSTSSDPDQASAQPRTSEIQESVEAVKNALEIRHLLNSEDRLYESNVASMASPLDDKEGAFPFDMSVRYGFQGVAGGFVRVFRDIVLIGESQVVQASAAPSFAGVGNDTASSAQALLEVYPFFCKTITIEKYDG